MEISGIVQTQKDDLYNFKFLLDRAGTTIAELSPKIQMAWDGFNKSVQPVEINLDENIFHTSFHYLLETAEQKQIAKVGIEEFTKLIPFVLSFIPQIDHVKILDNTANRKITYNNTQKSIEKFIVPIEKIEDTTQSEILILKHGNERVSIAIELKKTDGSYSVKNIEDIPKLFCDFPLIGSEDFHFPVIVNSFFFNPQTERNGVWLKNNNSDKEVIENQGILESAVELYKELVNYSVENNFFNLYNLATTKIPNASEKYFDKIWYKSDIQKPIRFFLKNSKVVETEVGRSTIEEIYFPDPDFSEEDRNIIWRFSFDLKVNKLPLERKINKWAKILWKDCKKVDINDLISDLKNQKKILTLSKTLEVDMPDTINWLNNCIDFIGKKGIQNDFIRNAIIPNQLGEFKTVNKLSLDEIEDESLKKIAKLVGYDYYEILIHKNIFFDNCRNTIKINDVGVKISDLLKTDNSNISDDRKYAIIKLSEWFDDNGERGKEYFSSLYRNKEKLYLDTIEDKNSLNKILRNKTPLSTIADIVEEVSGNPEKIKESLGKAQALDELLKEFKADNITDLKKILANQHSNKHPVKTEITQETLLSLGVSTQEELEDALKDENIANQFIHTSIPTEEMFEYAQKIICRAKNNIIEYLETTLDYDCDDCEELATTVIGGIKKKGLEITIVVRPSDNNHVIIYYKSEKDSLDYANAELWIEDGKTQPRQLTLGKILKNIGITKIPVHTI